jgi:hypothetical protein
MGHEVTELDTTTAVQHVLASFDQLSGEEQLRVAKEIQSRVTRYSESLSGVDFSPLSDHELASIADELFQMSDAEEEARRNGPA